MSEISPFLKADLKIITYFKVLPTSSDFQNLNLFQKLMLLYAIGNDEKERLDLISAVLDRVSMQTNPYVVETPKMLKKDHLLPNEHYNAEYQRHVVSAREKGIPDVSPVLQRGLDVIYKGKHAEGFTKVMIDNNPIQPVPVVFPKVKKDDPTELG